MLYHYDGIDFILYVFNYVYSTTLIGILCIITIFLFIKQLLSNYEISHSSAICLCFVLNGKVYKRKGFCCYYYDYQLLFHA